jgi:hypothetical protein
VRVAAATCAQWPELDPDSRTLLEPLRALGLEVEVAVWDDSTVDWSSYDLVLVRSTWDYVPRRREWLAWAGRVPRLANPSTVLAWNTDKVYLRDLAAAGLAVTPTTFVAPGEPYVPPPGETVVKPTISAGARDTARFARGEDGAALVARLHAEGRTAMVQPYLPGLEAAGETAVLVFGGEVSHAARKAPLLVPGALPYVSDDEVITPREPSVAQAQLALAAVAAAERITGQRLLYARVDLIPGPDGAPVVLELEAAEPSLFLTQAPGSAQRLAALLHRVLTGGDRGHGS